MIPIRKRRTSISSLGSFVQHEVDFSCSVCARRRDSFLEFEKGRQAATDETLTDAHRSSDHGLMLSGFTGVSTSEVSAVLNTSTEDDDDDAKNILYKNILTDNFLKEEKEKEKEEEIERIRFSLVASALNEKIMREKYILDAIQIAKNADVRRPSKRDERRPSESMLKDESLHIDSNALIIRSVPIQKRRLNDKKKREEKKEDDLMKLTVIEIDERLESLRQEERRIQERILRKK